MRQFLIAITALIACLSPLHLASAAEILVRGKIVVTQGHQTPSCRMVQLKRNDNGMFIWFRIPDAGVESGILAVTLTALTTGLDVDISYDPAVTSGCGPDPRISWISLRSANAQ